ncbi:hypothetical protein GCM10022394_10990 [Zobellella aerophila]|uniref:Aldehyde dehydrogenase domain-containing protein n=1 Tax=Zobellella aerophila TaxID=870480 RepID=A0ABP6VG24_9GAMM
MRYEPEFVGKCIEDMLLGGQANRIGGLENGFYIQPTIFQGDNRMRVFQEEIFGSAVGVTHFKDEAEALAIANDTEFGLGAGSGPGM